MLRNKKIISICLILFSLFMADTVGAKYIPNNKDTKLPPEKLDPNFIITDTSEYTELFDNENFTFYFREDRDVIAIYDKRNDYLWKTGLDTLSGDVAEEICFDKPRKVRQAEGCDPKEDRMNYLFGGIANSLVTIEYYDNTRQVVSISSATYDPNVKNQYIFSNLKKVLGENNHYILEVEATRPLISIKVHIYFTDTGISYEIRDEEITGDDANRLAGILITPFLGASGGRILHYDPEKDNFVIVEDKYRVPGYILVPDGPGALIRFMDYNTNDKKPLTSYRGYVYGRDYSSTDLYHRTEFRYVSLKEPRMPVFGISHGDGSEAAFVAYATSGDQHMEIIATPDEGRNMNYHFAYPRFNFNNIYYQIYNRAGWNFETIHDNRYHYDIKINYDFLAGDGSSDGLPANYIGMAKAYRNYLIKNNLLKEKTFDYRDIPTRIDFIMSDVKKNIVGYENVVVTNINDVNRILTDLKNNGIANINSGLLGYQDGGVTLGKPNKIDYDGSIGSKREFKDTIKELSDLGIDVSLSQNFIRINDKQISLSGNSIKHVSSWYTTYYLFDAEAPVNVFNYARAEKANKWLESHIKALNKISPRSTTIEGITNILLSDFNKDTVSREKTIEIYQKALEKISKDYLINSSNPNLYTWKYVDRYLDAPVFNSQYIIETDTVPFLQLVLNGSMEIYSPYSNFSFYTDSDVLRMIDYNVYPSFVLSHEPAYLLMATNSANYFSTEYAEYKDLIKSIYERVNGALKYTVNSEWINRKVIENGVIVNTYQNGIEILINYKDEPAIYKGREVAPLSYEIFEGE